MPEARLYIVHGSHPCIAVARALELKGIPYKVTELPPPMHAPIMRARFGERTVPGLKIDGRKLQGSTKIFRHLDSLQPNPPLFGSDDASRAKIEEAEAWGNEIIQPMARRYVWPAMKRHPAAAPSYSEHSTLPSPKAALPIMIRAVAPIEMAMNKASDETLRQDLEALPAHLDRIDAWITDGTLGGDPPNAADLQIFTSLRLMLTLDDLRPLIEGRPAGEHTLRLFPQQDGHMPAGTLPPEWLPSPGAAPATP